MLGVHRSRRRCLRICTIYNNVMYIVPAVVVRARGYAHMERQEPFVTLCARVHAMSTEWCVCSISGNVKPTKLVRDRALRYRSVERLTTVTARTARPGNEIFNATPFTHTHAHVLLPWRSINSHAAACSSPVRPSWLSASESSSSSQPCIVGRPQHTASGGRVVCIWDQRFVVYMSTSLVCAAT